MEEKLTPKNLRDFPNEDFENNKQLTSKEILPEEVRNDFRRVQKAEADLFPSSYLVKYAFFTLLSTIEAAEREVEEKDKHISALTTSAYKCSVDNTNLRLTLDHKNAEIEELKRELEEIRNQGKDIDTLI